MDNICYDFDKFLYPKIIKPIIDKAKDKVSSSFKSAVNFCENFNEQDFKVNLSKLYEEKREWLKKIYFSFFTEEKLLDMHKIAAVLCRCITRLKPFAFDVDKANKYIETNNKNKDTAWVIENFLVNYKVAYEVAMGVTLYDLFNKLGEIKDGDPLKQADIKYVIGELADKGLSKYRKGDTLVPIDHEPFYRSQIINLAINDINKRKFDYLGFATICFQLQQYTVLKYFK